MTFLPPPPGEHPSSGQPIPNPHDPSGGYGVPGQQRQPVAGVLSVAGAVVSGATTSIPLVSGEQVLYRGEFTPRQLLRHLKSVVVVTDFRVIVQTPNTLFGLIPRGYAEGSAPLSHVSDVISGDLTRTKQVLYGLLAVVMGLVFVAQGARSALLVVLALLLWVLGGYLLFTARELAIVFRTTGAGNHGTAAVHTERAELDQAKKIVNELLIARRG